MESHTSVYNILQSPISRFGTSKEPNSPWYLLPVTVDKIQAETTITKNIFFIFLNIVLQTRLKETVKLMRHHLYDFVTLQLLLQFWFYAEVQKCQNDRKANLSELKTLEWDILNPDRLIDLEINIKKRTSINPDILNSKVPSSGYI